MNKSLKTASTPSIIPVSLAGGFIPSVAEKLGYDKTELTKRAVEFYNFCRIRDLSAENDAKKAEWLANKEGKPFKAPKFLKDCTPESTQKAFLQVVAWNIPLDSRDFCYFYNNGGNMSAEPSYKGLLYVASQNGLEVDAGLVFSGDTFEMSESSAGDSYTLKRGNPFARKKIEGFYAFVKCARYSPKLYTFSFEELEAAKQASVRKMRGESPAWKFFPNDMYLKVGLKKALKISMAKIEIKSEVRAMFDDEVPEADETVQAVRSEKTALFASVEPAVVIEPPAEKNKEFSEAGNGGEQLSEVDEHSAETVIAEAQEDAEPPAVLLEMSAFMDKVQVYSDASLQLNEPDTIKKLKYVNDLRERLIEAGYKPAADEVQNAINKKLRRGL